jgi:CelD/BcsL family acetyltransferase involved in cellulose biosynthesis
MQVEIIDRLTKLRPLQEEWDRLNQSAADLSPFSSYAWITAWTECYLGRNEPRIIIVRNDGRLVGVAPFYLTSKFGIKILQLLGLKGVNGECVNFSIEPGLEGVVGTAIFDALLDSIGHWDAISFWGVRSNSSLQHLLFTYASRLLNETKVVTSVIGFAPILRLDGGWKNFLKTRSHKFRNNSRRHLAACDKFGIKLVKESDMKDHYDVIDRLISVESRSWQGIRGRPVIRANKGFFVRILPRMLECAEADIIWAYKDVTPLAFSLYLIQGDRVFLYIGGYDLSFKDLSLGSLVDYYAVRNSCDRGISVDDFMTDIGPVSYKKRWTKDYEITLKHVFIKRSLPGRLVGSALCLLKG